MAKQKYYVVWKGVHPGIYDSWKACQDQIQGFTGAVYKSFLTREEATAAFRGNARDFVGKTASGSKNNAAQRARVGQPIQNSLSVDAACSGNPGVLEYQGVNTKTKELLFHMGPFPLGTVNIGEFLALVHGLAMLKKNNSNLPIYSDSVTAMKWVRVKAVNTKLPRGPKNEELFKLVDRALLWLKNNEYSNPILKWQTAVWGEIPADFGRK